MKIVAGLAERGKAWVGSFRPGAGWALFLFLASLYFLTSTGSPPRGDAYAPFTGAIELIKGNGIYKSIVMPGQTFLLVPIAFLTALLVPRLPNEGLQWAGLILIADLFPAIVTAACAAALYHLARRLGHGHRLALFAALLYGLATPAAVYAKNFFPQSTEALFLTLSALGLLAARERDRASDAGRGAPPASPFRNVPLLLSGAAFGVLLLVKAVGAAYFPAMLGFLLFSRRGGVVGRLLAWGVPAFALALLFLPYNQAAHGGALRFGYGWGRDAYWGFATALPVGLMGLLISPGKGIFYYAPILALAIPGVVRLARRDLAAALFFLGIVAGALGTHALWWAWHGDHAWGPRYLVPILPFAVLFAVEPLRGFRPGRTLRTAALAALVLLSVGLQALGGAFAVDAYHAMVLDTVIPMYRPEDEERGPRDDEIHVHWIPEFSPLLGQAWLLRHALRDDPRDAYLSDYPWRHLRPDGAWAPRIPEALPRLDYWVTALPRNHPASRGAVAAVAWITGLVVLAGAVLVARAARRDD